MPDVILTASTTNLTVIRQATNTVPVVFVSVSDPVAQGFVASVARPGGNLTGFSVFEFSIGGKWLDLLKEISPNLARVGIIFNPETSPQSKFFVQSIETAARSLHVQTVAIPVRSTADIEPALDGFAREPNGGLIQPTDSFMRLRQNLLVEVASRHRLPVISGHETFPKDGGLMYYGASVNFREQFRQAAGYVDRILKGAKPADLPVQRADKYHQVAFESTLKTARALRINRPAPVAWCSPTR